MRQRVALERALLHEYDVTLPHGDAARLESELRSRGVEVLDASYAAAVTLRLGLVDPAPLDGWLAGLTAGQVTADPAGQRWVDLA